MKKLILCKNRGGYVCAKPLTCVEICAGAGGQALGLAMAGFVHVALVEYEADYCNTLKQNRPEWNVICADVRNFDGKTIRGSRSIGRRCSMSAIFNCWKTVGKR